MHDDAFLREHQVLARRYFLQTGVLGLIAGARMSGGGTAWGMMAEPSAPLARPLRKAVAEDKLGVQPEPYFTPQARFRDVSRGTPLPHALPEEKRRAVGLTRETWRLEVVSDPEQPARLGRELTRANQQALDFPSLLKLGERHTVRFPKLMTCLNLGCPLGMGLWEGVPLREVLWLTQPRENLRRVFYHGYHNDDPAQLFRSSLPVGRVLEDPFDLPPVILCFKLNGDWLDPERGGPVRMVVPEAYGFKSIKWLTQVVVSNRAHGNDTYAEQNNDVDSPLKTFAATLEVPREVPAGQPIAVSGYAQVGISGLAKVQVVLEPDGAPRPEKDPFFTQANWADATLLPPPKSRNALPDARVPADTQGFDAAGAPQTWPLRLTKAHWAAVLPGVPAGSYTFRCRAIDAKGQAQPMPRPFQKSGHAAIEAVGITVKP